MSGRKEGPERGCAVGLALLVYLFVTGSTFLGAMLGECLPLDAPGTAACDLGKSIDFALIPVVALFGLIVAGMIARRSATKGVVALLSLSFLPMLASMIAGRAVSAWG